MPAMIAAVVLLGWLLGLGAVTAIAQPPVTTCALTGAYAVSAALTFEGTEAQFSGQLTFAPPAACAAGVSGVATLEVAVLATGSPAPAPVGGTFLYAVDASGRLTVGPGLITGTIAGLADYTGVANAFVFEADPAIGPTVRFAGAGVRVVTDPAVYDSNGVEVGKMIGMTAGIPVALLRIGGGGAFTLGVERLRFVPVVGAGPAFQSANCTGTAYIQALSPIPHAALLLSGTGIAYPPDLSASPLTISVNSILFASGCVGQGGSSVQVRPALPPIDLSLLFTPPFTVR